MATSRAAKKDEPGTEVATKPAAEVVVQNSLSDAVFMEHAGAGLEGATAESFAIPFVTILQKGSPQVDETSGVAIEGAKQGMIFENITGRMFNGNTGVLLVPCAYKRVFLRWGPRSGDGAGFKGEMSADEVAKLRDQGKIKDIDGKLYVALPDGTVNDKKCDRVADTRNHYVLLINEEDGSWMPALLSLTSTQIKKSRMLASMIANVKRRAPDGRLYQPASFANQVRMTTVPESNDKGSWMGAKFEMEGFVSSAEIYKAALAFHDSVQSGAVNAKYEDTETEPGTEGSGEKF